VDENKAQNKKKCSTPPNAAPDQCQLILIFIVVNNIVKVEK